MSDCMAGRVVAHGVFTPPRIAEVGRPTIVVMSATASSGVRMADVLASFSVATDLGLGRPIEHTKRSTVVSISLGRTLGLDLEACQVLHDVALLTYCGCHVYGNDAAEWFGDDIGFREEATRTDLVGMSALRLMVRWAGSDGGPGRRLGKTIGLLASRGRDIAEQMAEHCAAAGHLAARLGLSDEVRRGVEQSYARWDGKGVPFGVGGEELSLETRIAHVAGCAETMHQLGGVDTAVEAVTARRGTDFDPSVVDAFVANATALLAPLEGNDPPDLDEPMPQGALSEAELDAVLEALGDYCDLRCPFFAGHASGTAELATGAAEVMQLPAESTTVLRRAALAHDMGRAGVPGSVWNKPSQLTLSEAERVRLHPYLVERMFARPAPLRRIGVLAATHHERMDGSGYHRGVAGAAIAAPARILAAADAYHAMTQPRPHRPALDPDAAARTLKSDASRGLFDPTAVDAVLTAAGHRPNRRRASGPGGLTARESEVLGLAARGLPNKAIARELGISAKTVSNHIEHVYEKLGVSSRAAAALRAMELGLVREGGAR